MPENIIAKLTPKKYPSIVLLGLILGKIFVLPIFEPIK